MMLRKFIIILLILAAFDSHSQISDITYFHSEGHYNLKELITTTEFKTATNGSYLGSTDKHVYVRVKLPEEHNYTDLLINNALIDTLVYYKLADGEFLDSGITGQGLKYDTRRYDYQDYIVHLKEGGKTVDELYFLIRSSKPINLPIQLHNKDSLIETLYTNDLIYGAFIGIILVMLFYNLIVYFAVKDESYLYYVAYLLAVALAQSALFGYTDRFLFGGTPWLNSNMTFISGSIVGIFSLLFIRNFLHLESNAPRTSKIFSFLIGVDILALVLCLFNYRVLSYNLINLVAFVGSILALYVAINLLRIGYRPAKFFIFAWSIFLLGVFIFVFKDYDILPFNSYTRRSILIGSVAEVVLLSIALADKINIFRIEKEESQAAALKALRENERIIKEQNIILERKVSSRTMELQEANEELQNTLNNLKDTQAQLVNAEKMASLGQLTAGIAHEINNPINFVTSNITPLRRDLTELYEIIDAYVSVTVENVEESLQKAHELRKNLDYHYLKEEIDSLVNGISDGANRTQEIVKGLRTFSRLDEDVLKLADLREGLESTLVILQNKIRDMIVLEQNYSEELGAIECFPGKINQVFMNILNNAIYAVQNKTYQEGEDPTIFIETRKEGEWAVVSLKDNGIGMSEQTRKKIFEPFYTTKEVGEGTGLGMSIVFKIIEKHKGTVEVISEEGVGTEFIITLPLRQPNEHRE